MSDSLVDEIEHWFQDPDPDRLFKYVTAEITNILNIAMAKIEIFKKWSPFNGH